MKAGRIALPGVGEGGCGGPWEKKVGKLGNGGGEWRGGFDGPW